VHTVVETPEFIIAAKHAGMTDEERWAAIDHISENADAGEIIPGSGGARKVRILKEGGGKSGGYRVITYYTNKSNAVLLVTVISKGKRGNLTEKQKTRQKVSRRPKIAKGD
jgi:hypothetical protein